MTYARVNHACTSYVGKTNFGSLKLYGRTMRCKDATQCAFGALGFYLCLRFYITKEFDSPVDFTRNERWFDIKLLVDAYADSYEHEMSDSTYAKGIGHVLKAVGCITNHYRHLGRVLGPGELELLENDGDGTRTLGNWDPKMQEKAYSIKLPMKTMRRMAKFVDGDGMCFCPRTDEKPDSQTLGMVFPWVTEAKKIVQKEIAEADDGGMGGRLQTALCFLEMMEYLAEVVLQDAAAMAALAPDRMRHVMFQLVPVFKSPGFLVSRLIVALCCCFLCCLSNPIFEVVCRENESEAGNR
jgi:hypothetical protein